MVLNQDQCDEFNGLKKEIMTELAALRKEIKELKARSGIDGRKCRVCNSPADYKDCHNDYYCDSHDYSTNQVW